MFVCTHTYMCVVHCMYSLLSSSEFPAEKTKCDTLAAKYTTCLAHHTNMSHVTTHHLATHGPTSSSSPSNVTSYSVTARLSRLCTVSTVSISLIILLLMKISSTPSLIPSQFPNPPLMPLDYLILWILLLAGTNYHNLFSHHHHCPRLNLASARCS